MKFHHPSALPSWQQTTDTSCGSLSKNAASQHSNTTLAVAMVCVSALERLKHGILFELKTAGWGRDIDDNLVHIVQTSGGCPATSFADRIWHRCNSQSLDYLHWSCLLLTPHQFPIHLDMLPMLSLCSASMLPQQTVPCIKEFTMEWWSDCGRLRDSRDLTLWQDNLHRSHVASERKT